MAGRLVLSGLLGVLPVAGMPVNDDFADAAEIAVDQPLPITVSGNTAGATVEPGEIALDPTLAASVWYKVTSPADGVVRVDTDGSDFPTRLVVGIGTGYGDLGIVTADDDPVDGTSVVFEVATGVEYHFGVFGANGETGNLVLNLRETEGASVSGHVTAVVDGAPLGGVTVQAMVYAAPFERWKVVAETSTHGLGGYTLQGLEPGASYRIRAIDGSGAHAAAYFVSDLFVDDAQPVVPDPDEFGIDLALFAGGGITGSVSASGGSGLGGIAVIAYLWNATAGEWQPVATTTSDPAGGYLLSGLPAGNYRVGMVDEEAGMYLPGFVNGVDLGTAAEIVVGLGQQVVADPASLLPAGSIGGRVSEAGSGSPLEGIQVQTLGYDAPSDEWVPVGPRVVTAADGSYAIAGLPYDEYRVAFADFDEGMRRPTLFGGSPDPILATPVVLDAGTPQAVGIDQSLEPVRISAVSFAAPDTVGLGFPGNPFVQVVLESSDDFASWQPQGLPFHAETETNHREAPAGAGRRFWRLRGPTIHGLAPVADIHERTSYAQAQAAYRWIDRYQFGSGFFDFISAFGYGDFDGNGQTDALVFPGIAYSLTPFPAQLTLDLDGTPSDGSALFVGGIPGGLHPRKLLVGELNGDGVDDVVMIDHGYDADPFPGAPLQVLLSTGDGRITTTIYPEHTGFHHAGALGDYDHDGDLDLFLASPTDLGTVNLLLENDGLGHFTPANQLVGEVWNRNIWTSEFFDLDGDGFLELAIGGEVAVGPNTVLWGSSRGTYGAEGMPLELPDGWDVYDYEAEDLDGDGDRDLLVTLAEIDAASHRFALFINHGGRHFIDETFERFDNPTNDVSWIDFVFVQDVDGDGDPDIVADRRSELLKWENDGTGRFTAGP